MRDGFLSLSLHSNKGKFRGARVFGGALRGKQAACPGLLKPHILVSVSTPAAKKSGWPQPPGAGAELRLEAVNCGRRVGCRGSRVGVQGNKGDSTYAVPRVQKGPGTGRDAE